MNEVPTAFAKLAGVLKSLQSLLGTRDEWGGKARLRDHFSVQDVAAYFQQSSKLLVILQECLPELFGDLPPIDTTPTTEMAEGAKEPFQYGRQQLEKLSRIIEQIFEIRSSSELAVPVDATREPRVFVSHGRASDWREVQAFLERDIGIRTLELAQEPNLGRTVLQKLEEEAQRCSSAVIVMTGDDLVTDGSVRARENVLHEIGYFQGRFGLRAVCLLHEEGTNIPSNIHGLVYIPFPKGYVSAAFGALTRELKELYRRL